MSEHVYADPDIIKKVHFGQDDKENIMDIYVSAESLRVYDNPWVEDISPNKTGPAETQHPATSVISENSGKRNQVRTYCTAFLVAVCLLLLAGIICIGLQKDKETSDLKITTNQLTATIFELRSERDSLWKRCDKNRRCKKVLLGLTDTEEDDHNE